MIDGQMKLDQRRQDILMYLLHSKRHRKKIPRSRGCAASALPRRGSHRGGREAETENMTSGGEERGREGEEAAAGARRWAGEAARPGA